MTVKTSTARYDGTGLRFTARTGSGHDIVLDDSGGNAGPRPVEMLLVGQAGCTGMDVMSILQKKRQTVTRYEVSVSAEQRDGQPAIYTRADVVHLIEGPAVEEAAVRRAIELSATKYCSVAAMLSAGTVEIHHRYRILGPGGADPVEGEVLVAGPHADPDAMSQPQPVGTAA
ncbi:MAG: OsmC family protein [Candidatus Limnocylindrales bacterium]